LQKNIREIRSDQKNSENLKKTIERLQNENAKIKDEMMELAKITREEKEKIGKDLEKSVNENEEYKSIIGQLEGKLTEIEKLVNERNLHIQNQDETIAKLTEGIEIKNDELSSLKKTLDTTLEEKEIELENLKKVASNSMRSFYANLSQNTTSEPISPLKENSMMKSKISKCMSETRGKKKVLETSTITEILRPWMEIITSECIKQIENEICLKSDILKLVQEQNENLKQNELDSKKIREKISEYHEGIRMRTEELEGQLFESIRKNKMLVKIAKGYELTIEALEKQLNETKELCDNYKNLLIIQNSEVSKTIENNEQKITSELRQCAKKVEENINQIITKKDTQEQYLNELTLIKARLGEEVECLSEKCRKMGEELSFAQAEMSQIEQIASQNENSHLNIDEYMSKRVEEIHETIEKMRNEIYELRDAKEMTERVSNKLKAMEELNSALKDENKKITNDSYENSKLLDEYKKMLAMKDSELENARQKLENDKISYKEIISRNEENINKLKIEISKLNADLQNYKDLTRKLKDENSKISSMFSKSEQNIDITSKQLQVFVAENTEYNEKLKDAENYIRKQEEQIKKLMSENSQFIEKLELNEKIMKDEYEKYLRNNQNLKNENEALLIKLQDFDKILIQLENENKGLKTALFDKDSEIKNLKQEIENAKILALEREKQQISQTKKEPEIHEDFTNSKFNSSRLTFGEESSAQPKSEEFLQIKEKASKMAPTSKIEYYENLIEALIHKRQRTKKSCEKRIAEFEQILRLLEIAVQAAASKGKSKEQLKIKMEPMQNAVFSMIKNNVALTSFLQTLLSIIDSLK